ncbi:hypothetical protein GRI62_00930 [Erythrobacter arachoides]|uniref:Uncharacterized protein n=1 Tax=Aurantiacibacter arachoides TaxID=1850444 RepID=A0A845A3I8_9SPHN|nr:hypothetical protein [Aurantiacibacter arachoides]MXO92169.1 hypothetical protein [Aurantiacibacter arachoides]GGD59152.1 hypothetical protein GCM10011411_19210 [Aurantiacibacter arachoides]
MSNALPDTARIAADPRWLPHSIDLASERMLFVHIDAGDLTAPGFLADIDPGAAHNACWLPFDAVRSMQVEAGPLHFIFHTAFCRSTLLARALNIEGISVGMAEPGVIAHLASAGERAHGLIGPVCNLLSRQWETAGGRSAAVFVKPTNHANALIPALLSARPDATAVLMTNPLPTFLRSVDSRALMGRRWGRQLYLETMGYIGMDLGLDGREQFLMTDLQAAGIAWFLSQRYFAGLLNGPDAARVRLLDGDRFDRDRTRALEAVLSLAGVAFDKAGLQAVVEGPLFRRHAKLGGAFAGEAAVPAPSFAQEAEQVGQWIGMIAEQAGVAVPVPQTLF